MSALVVIQGKPVSQQQAFGNALTGLGNEPNHQANYGLPQTSTSANTSREGKVESSCNDPIFAVLFIIAVLAIAGIGFTLGMDALSAATEDTGDSGSTSASNSDYQGYITVTVIIIFLSFFGAGGGMALLFWIPAFLIKAALIFTVVLSLISLLMAVASGNVIGMVLGFLFFALTCCYAYMVWSRIPFATANLVTAMTAIRSNLGVAIYAYFFSILAGIWALIWVLAFVGLFDKTYSCDDVTNTCSSPSYGILFGLFLAFFFVQQVLQSCIHVTVAGTVGTWWYAPDESGCCSSGVNNSFIRTMTTSFGSICFGSLLVAILQALKAIANAAQQNGDAQCLACIAECILGCLASLLEYFNKWAYIYVGIYGMPYMKAGKSVFELFQNRGWEAIIADDLVGNVLLLISVIVGILMGCIGLALESLTDFFENAGGDAALIAFVLGFLVGLLITSILMSTIGSSVNAVIVLFAEGPAEFQQNYPELSNKMRQVWNEVYPGSV